VPNERPDERLARHIVSTALGVPVDRYDDGTASAQPDAKIRYPDRTAWLEIIGDHDSRFRSQWSELEKIDHKLMVPELRQRWLARLTATARIRDIKRVLPDTVLRWQDATTPADLAEIERTLDRVGIDGMSPIEEDPPQGGVVHLHTSGWSGTAGRDDTLGEWVVDVLAEQDDVPRKLAACPGGERHAFIWATVGSDYQTQFKLENRDDEPLPVAAPDLPDGVTHVWVAGGMSSQVTLAWFPDRGWWRAWAPDDGYPVTLTDEE